MHKLVTLPLLLLASACGGPTPGTKTPEPAGTTPVATPSASAPAVASSAPVVAENLELPERVEILGGRMAVHVPSGARVAPRPHSIMAADEADTDETRVLLIPGKGEESLARFVLLVREAFVLGTGSAEADAPKLLGDAAGDYRLAPVAAGKGLGVVSYAPKGEPKGSPIFVLGALAERADHSLVELNFYILTEMASERASYEKKSLAILQSLEAGKGDLPGSKKARIETGTGQALLLELPRAAVVTRQQGPDFSVFHVREIGQLGELSSEIGVYVGGHPSLQYKQAEVPEKKVKKSAGTLLGHATDWYTWEPDKGRLVSEALAPLGKNDKVHVFVAGEPARVTELRKAASAMRVEKR